MGRATSGVTGMKYADGDSVLSMSVIRAAQVATEDSDENVQYVFTMTDGGFAHRGVLFCPSDALDEDPVVLRYLRRFPREIVRLAPETTYSINGLSFTTSGRHVHQVETYGFRFGDRLGWITDSAYYDGIAQQHQADVMLIHTILLHCRPELPHLCIDDAERIIRDAKPRLAILTHYGMTVWRANPKEIAADLTQRIGTEVQAAFDGMSIEV